MSRQLAQTVNTFDLAQNTATVLQYTHNEADSVEVSLVIEAGNDGSDSLASGSTVTRTATVNGGALVSSDAALVAPASGVVRFDAPAITLHQGDVLSVALTSDAVADSSVHVDSRLIDHGYQESDTEPSLATKADVAAVAARSGRSPSLVVASTDGLGVADVLGHYPVPGSVELLDELEFVADVWTAVVDRDTTNNLYFDSVNGDDGNDGLSEANAKQTWAAVRAAAAADTTLWLARGSVWRHGANESLTLPSGCNVRVYGDGAAPWITGLRLQIPANTAAWTLAAGDRWTATLADANSLHPSTWSADTELTYAASTADCEATPNSYHLDGSTVSVNFDGRDPNTITWWANHAQDYGSDASGIVWTGNNLIEGVVCSHNGYGRNATVATNQSWGILGTHTGSEVGVIRECECHCHALHNIGHLDSFATGGGITLFDRVTFGGTRIQAGHNLVDYAATGGQQVILRDTVCVSGRTPATDNDPIDSTRSILSHTANGALCGYAATIRHQVTGDRSDCSQEFGYFNDMPAAGSVFGDYRAVHVLGHQEPGRNSRAVMGHSDNAYIACDFEGRCERNTSVQALTTAPLQGLVIACRWVNDFELVTGTTVYAITNPSSGTSVVARWYHTEFAMLNVANGLRVMTNRDLNDQNQFAIADARVINCVLYATGDGQPNPGVGNGVAVAAGAVYDSNAVKGFNGSTADRGYSAWSNTIEPDRLEDARGAMLHGEGASVLAAAIEVDGDHRPLVAPGGTIGPWGRARPRIETRRLPLSADQETTLQLAASEATAAKAAAEAVTAPKLYQTTVAPAPASTETAINVVLDPPSTLVDKTIVVDGVVREVESVTAQAGTTPGIITLSEGLPTPPSGGEDVFVDRPVNVEGVKVTAIGSDAVSGLSDLPSGDGGSTVTADDISDRLTFRFPGTGSSITASNEVQLTAGSSQATIQFDLNGVLDDDDTITTIGTPTVDDSAATVGAPRLHSSRRRINIPLTGITQDVGRYTITIPYTTTTGDAIPRRGVLSVE